MLELTEHLDEENLVAIAKGNIWQFVKPGQQRVDVPFKNPITGKIKRVRFDFLNDQWVFTDIRE